MEIMFSYAIEMSGIQIPTRTSAEKHAFSLVGRMPKRPPLTRRNNTTRRRLKSLHGKTWVFV